MRGLAILAVVLCCVVAGYSSYTTLTAISSRNVCAAVDRQARVLRGIIIRNAVESRKQEAVYRKLHLPPYEERLAQARRTADAIRGCP